MHLVAAFGWDVQTSECAEMVDGRKEGRKDGIGATINSTTDHDVRL